MNNCVAIVILNYKNWQDTIECLQSVLNITYTHTRIIVVDNDSQNNSLAYIESWLAGASYECLLLDQEKSEKGDFIEKRFVLIQAALNRGYAAGNNIGIRWAIRAGDKYVLILNNDTLVQDDFLEPLVGFIDTRVSVGMVGPKIIRTSGEIDKACARRRPEALDYVFRVGLLGMLFPNNLWQRRHYYVGEYDFKKPFQVDMISGSCMLGRTDILDATGLLDEHTFLYFEEAILHEKLRDLGISTWIVPSSQIIHKGGQSTKTNNNYLCILQKSMKSLVYYLEVYRNYPKWLINILLVNQRLVYGILKLRNLSKMR